jgi:hypothetical protein
MPASFRVQQRYVPEEQELRCTVIAANSEAGKARRHFRWPDT